MKIAIVVNDLQPYGSQRVATALAAAYARLDHDVRLLTVQPIARDELDLADGVARSMVVRRSRGARGYQQAVRDLHSSLGEYQPDVVISHMVLANLITLAATSWGPLSSIPVVVTEHNVASLVLKRERSMRAMRALARRLYPRATRVVGVSDAVVSDAIATYRLAPKLGTTIYNPVDVDAIRILGGIRSEHRWLTTDLRSSTLLCVGEFRAAKGQDLLIEAMASLPEYRLIFLGGGALLEPGRALAARNGVAERIDFAGYSGSVPSFLAEAAALVMPSRFEGFGLVAVEAAAVGTAVVGTRVSGLTELVPKCVPGLLVEPESADALAEGIRMVATLNPSKPDLGDFEPLEVAKRYLRAAGVFST